MPSWKAWVQRPSGLIKMEPHQRFQSREGREVVIEANADNQS